MTPPGGPLDPAAVAPEIDREIRALPAHWSGRSGAPGPGACGRRPPRRSRTDPAERPCPDGTVCPVIGDVTTENAGFATLRCADGLVIVLQAFQAQEQAAKQSPYVVSDGLEGWYVLLAVSRAVRCAASIQDRPWPCKESQQ